MKRSSIQAATLVVAAFLTATACTDQKGNSSATPSGPEAEMAALIQKGRATYQTSCIACHNTDPKKVGAIGPDVFGSSKELIEARVLRGEYPPGYTPKRQTHAMVALPHLKGQIDALHAYLNAK